MKTSWICALLMVPAVSACGSRSEPPPAPAARPPSRPPAPPVAAKARCPSEVDLRALLSRHAGAYGSAEAVAKGLPITMKGEAAIDAKKGRAEQIVGERAHRATLWIGPITASSGIDAAGTWTSSGATGVVESLVGDEGSSVALDAFLLRRGYLDVSNRARVEARCVDDGAAPRVDVAYRAPELGDPVLAFDLASGALLSIVRRDPTGKRITTTIEGWSEPDAGGVRWMRRMTDHPPTGSAVTIEYTSIARGLACDGGGEACLRRPRDEFSLTWPSATVRVPMTFYNGQIVVRAKLGGRDVWAVLDSGAGITAVDATTPAGEAFKPSMDLEGAGATQKVRLGVGRLDGVTLAGLRADNVPTASVPIPALESFGAKRPELILGYSFFAAAAVRVDYKKREVVLAKDAAGLVAAGARAISMRVADGKLLADAKIEGHDAIFQLDSGSSGGLDINQKWAAAHGLPGGRPTARIKGRFGAGSAETTSTLFRYTTAAPGPIAYDGALASISEGPEPGDVAGLAGNDLYARCDAVVFDHAARKLWTEGSCDRPLPERKMGMRLAKKPDPKVADRPWTVGMLVPGGAADKAGLKVGDRVLEIGGKPVVSDLEPFEKIEQQPSGTKVPVVLVRDGKKERVTVELRPLLSSP